MKYKIEKLNSSKFSYELYNMNNSYDDYSKAIGYCDSLNNSVFPKQNMICLMFEDVENGIEKWWFHFPYSMANDIFELEEELIETEQPLDDFQKELEQTYWQRQMLEIKKSFIAKWEIQDAFTEILKDVNADNNNAGLMYFVRVKGDNNGWWAFNPKQAEETPDNVRVVNAVGGFHYKNFTKKPNAYDSSIRAWVESEYEFTTAKNREELGDDE